MDAVGDGESLEGLTLAVLAGVGGMDEEAAGEGETEGDGDREELPVAEALGEPLAVFESLGADELDAAREPERLGDRVCVRAPLALPELAGVLDAEALELGDVEGVDEGEELNEGPTEPLREPLALGVWLAEPASVPLWLALPEVETATEGLPAGDALRLDEGSGAGEEPGDFVKLGETATLDVREGEACCEGELDEDVVLDALPLLAVLAEEVRVGVGAGLPLGVFAALALFVAVDATEADAVEATDALIDALPLTEAVALVVVVALVVAVPLGALERERVSVGAAEIERETERLALTEALEEGDALATARGKPG